MAQKLLSLESWSYFKAFYNAVEIGYNRFPTSSDCAIKRATYNLTELQLRNVFAQALLPT